MRGYPSWHPAVTVDCAAFGITKDASDLRVLLIRRDLEPYRGRWALPGRFVRADEDLETAARRELEDETGASDLPLEQLGAFGAPGRDPRGRVIMVAYLAIVNFFGHPAAATTEAGNAAWFRTAELPLLAFDHAAIIGRAVERLRAKLRDEPIVFEFLPESFTLRQVQRVTETILGTALDKRNFRKKIRATGLLVPLDEVEMDVAHRAARLFRFDRRRYEEQHGRGSGFSR